MGNSRARTLWTKEEVDYLVEYWGRFPIQKISRHLKRTTVAVQRKVTNLKLGGCYGADGSITCWQLAKALAPNGSCQSLINRLISKGLPVRIINLKRRNIKAIDLPNFWKWAENNKHCIDWFNLEENLLGIEPAWVKECRKINYENFNRNRRNKLREWTKQEDDNLKYLVETGKSLSVIGQRLNRSESSVRRRCWDLYLPKPKSEEQKRWTQDEVKKAVLMKSEGYHVTNIAKALKRTENSVYAKLYYESRRSASNERL